ncbi:MAG: hypothetical protein NZ580_01900 [Bacteroidia bacterium]|nr:hypothetical protein [Bacteroidia bacterium]MDW8235969.1 hypothetical protein [Bacteroidia bacterium]
MEWKKIIIPILFVFGGISCKRENIVFSREPFVEFVSASPNRVSEGGNIEITIRYRDGDGDLGGRSDNAPDLFLIDLRDSTLFPTGYDGILRYNMPRFYEGPEQSIQGTITLTVSGVVRLNPALSAEELRFEIYVRDRRDQESNRVRTTPVYIVP